MTYHSQMIMNLIGPKERRKDIRINTGHQSEKIVCGSRITGDKLTWYIVELSVLTIVNNAVKVANSV